MEKTRLMAEDLAKAHDGLCGVFIGDGPCSCLVHWVEALQKEADAANFRTEALRKALRAECRREPCGEDCYGGYQRCSGCEARAKAALGDTCQSTYANGTYKCDKSKGHKDHHVGGGMDWVG